MFSRTKSRGKRGTQTYEIDSDGGDVGLGVGIIGETQQQARLSNTGVTDKQKLEEVVVSVRAVSVEPRRFGPNERALTSTLMMETGPKIVAEGNSTRAQVSVR